nr:hypothetical protein [uncultured Treponema sp.]
MENNCFMGINCTVIDDVVVKNKTLIGSGANIVSFSYTYKMGGVFVGNPAKMVAGKKSMETKI